MPLDVRMIASSVGENNKLEVTFAALNLASTRLGRVSDRPRSILMSERGATAEEEGVDRASAAEFTAQTLTLESMAPLHLTTTIIA